MTQKEIGTWGEEYAARHLLQQGWNILRRNYYSRYGEIDIIAFDAQYILFVEVKTRAPGSWSTPAQAVDKAKQRRLLLTAQAFLAQYPVNLQPRFDVCEVYLNPPAGDSAPVLANINYIHNAF